MVSSRLCDVLYVMLYAAVLYFHLFMCNVCTYCILTTVLKYFITARLVCIARTMPWQDVCLSVCHTPVLSLNGYRYPQKFFHHRVAPPFWFSYTKRDVNVPMWTFLTGVWNARGYEKITIFDQYMALSRN